MTGKSGGWQRTSELSNKPVHNQPATRLPLKGEISMIFDKSLYEDSYIEDCEVCCRPIQIQYYFAKELESFSAESLED